MADPNHAWRRMKNGWMAIVARFGFAQTLVLLGGFYTFVVGPVAVLLWVGRRDFLGRRGLRGPGSAWLAADTSPPDLERAKLLS